MIEHRVAVRGMRHHVVEWPGAGPTLILLHGYLDHARVFDKLAAALEGFRLLAPDFRGHGDSDRVPPGGYYYFPDYIADLHAIAHALAKPPFALLGHSMGGGVAASLAGAFPELVSQLVLVEGLGPPTMAAEEAPLRLRAFVEDLARAAARPPRVFPSAAAAAARLRERNPRIAEADALAFAEHGTRAVDGGVAWKFDPLHQTRAPYPFLEAALIAALRRITAPVLVIEGADGWRLDDASRARRLAALPNPRTLLVAGAGHHVHLDAPAEVAAAVRAFLR